MGFVIEVEGLDNGLIQCISKPPIRSKDLVDNPHSQPSSIAAGTLPPTSPPPGASCLSPWTPSGALSTEHLLLSAAIQHAEMQLSGIQAYISQHAQQLGTVLGSGWKVTTIRTGNNRAAAPEFGINSSQEAAAVAAVVSSGGTPDMPALQCSVRAEPALTFHLNSSDGQPRLTLGSALSESTPILANEAKNIVSRAQTVLLKRLETLLATETPPEEGSKALAWAAAVAAAVVETWGHLAATQRRLDFESEALRDPGLARVALPRCLHGIELGGRGSGMIGVPEVGIKEEKQGGSSSQQRSATPGSTAVLRCLSSLPAPKLSSSLMDIIPMSQKGSLVGFLLADVSTAGAAGGTSGLTLVLCWATPRGVPTGLFRTLPVPEEVLENENIRSKGMNGVSGRPISGKRKRHDEEEPEEVKQEFVENGNRVRPSSSGRGVVSRDNSNRSTGGSIDWSRVKRWCFSTTGGYQLEAQLVAAGLLKLEKGKEKGMSGAEIKKRGGDEIDGRKKQLVVVLGETWIGKKDDPVVSNGANAVATSIVATNDVAANASSHIESNFSEEQALVSWDSENFGNAFLASHPDVALDAAGIGKFAVLLNGGIFSSWQDVMQEHGLHSPLVQQAGRGGQSPSFAAGSGSPTSSSHSAPSSFEVALSPCGGIEFQGTLSKGMSPVEVIVRAGACLRTHACALCLASAIKQQQQLDQQQEESEQGSSSGIVKVSISSVDLDKITLRLDSPALPALLGSSGRGRSSDHGVVTIYWSNRRNTSSGSTIGTASGTGTGTTAFASLRRGGDGSSTAVKVVGCLDPTAAAAALGGSKLPITLKPAVTVKEEGTTTLPATVVAPAAALRTEQPITLKPAVKEEGIPTPPATVVGSMICKVTIEPSVPQSLLNALEAALQRGEESIFFAALRSAFIGAAALEAKVLNPAAQKTAGLLPGALFVDHCTFEAPIPSQLSSSPSPMPGTSPGGGAEYHQLQTQQGAIKGGSCDIGHCSLLVRQLGRALQVELRFKPSGQVNLRVRELPPPLSSSLQQGTHPSQSSEPQNAGAIGGVKREPWFIEVWLKVLEAAGVIGAKHEGGIGDWSYFSATLSSNYLAEVLERLLHGVSCKAYN